MIDLHVYMHIIGKILKDHYLKNKQLKHVQIGVQIKKYQNIKMDVKINLNVYIVMVGKNQNFIIKIIKKLNVIQKIVKEKIYVVLNIMKMKLLQINLIIYSFILYNKIH